MMRLQSSHNLPGSAAGIAILLGASMLASPAAAELKGGVDVSVAGRVASNPFNEQSPGAAVISFSPSADPWLSYQDPDTTIGVQGNVIADQYSNNYGRTTTALVSANASQQMSSRFGINGSVGYSNSNNATNAFLLQQAPDPNSPILPGTPLPDVSIVGLRVHTQTLYGRLGAGLTLSQYDSVSFYGSAGTTRSNASGTSDFNNFGGGLTYNRKFSSRTSGQLSMQVNKVDYLRTAQGDGTIYSPMVGVSHRLGEHMDLQVNAGVSISNSKTFTGATLNTTAFAGNVQLCDHLGHGSLCLRGSRAVQPSALGGIGVTTEASLSFDRTIGQFGSLVASIRYGRADQGALAGAFKQDLFGMQVSYNHRFTHRLSVFVTPSYSKIFDNISPRGSDVEVRAGVKYRFGAIE